ncbi:phosphonate ABC transporter ATP-binding protein [Undibacterium sp. Dicai25W]|uniref:phosphonate ABC transporter ATP-binding protein n=1 Tax=Undibacterium sp. Dicai25W TaxID=3413034 RepID=UPI003BF159F3
MTAPQLRLQNLFVQHPDAVTGVFEGKQPALKNNGKFALHDINLTIARGEQIAIIGPSGAGKTTLLHTLAFAHQASSGVIIFNEKSPWELSSSERHDLRRQLFLAPQTPPLPARQRVVTAILAGKLPQWSFATALRNLIKPVAPLEAYQVLSRFNLQDKLYARVDKLSGGERQRCGLARLLLSTAQLLLVDEPLSALDPQLAAQTLETLQQEASTRNASLICSLHQVDHARSKFTRIIGLREGKIQFDSHQVTDQMIADLYQNTLPEMKTDAYPLVSHIDKPVCY